MLSGALCYLSKFRFYFYHFCFALIPTHSHLTRIMVFKKITLKKGRVPFLVYNAYQPSGVYSAELSAASIGSPPVPPLTIPV